MKLIGLMPVRNEDWCLGLTMRAALLWCDAVVVYLHACTDGSRHIVEQVIRENERGRLIVIHESDPKWDEMRHRQEMLEAARRDGATHVAIVDADEVLTGNLLTGKEPGAADWLRIIPDTGLLQLPLYYLRGSLTRYHSNGIWGNRITSVAFAADERAHWSGDQFHSREPSGVKWQPYRPIQQGQGGVMHLWGVSDRRLKAKHALYKLTERLRWPDKPVGMIDRTYSWAIHGDAKVSQYGTPANWSYAETPESWWAPYKQWLKYVDLNAVPAQEEQCRRIIAEHGREKFAGLDLFDVA